MKESRDQVGASPLAREPGAQADSSRKPPWLLKWRLVILAVLSRVGHDPLVLPDPRPERLMSVAQAEGPPGPRFPDQMAEEYKEALGEAFRAQREERYSHLNEAQFSLLGDTVQRYSDVIVIDGVAPSVVKDYLFDIELTPGAKPSRAQLPKLSPAEMQRERFHVEKEEALGHLRVPTDEQKSDWSCRTHIVAKKDDPNGRWICDFRALNKFAEKRATPLGDIFI